MDGFERDRNESCCENEWNMDLDGCLLDDFLIIFLKAGGISVGRADMKRYDNLLVLPHMTMNMKKLAL